MPLDQTALSQRLPTHEEVDSAAAALVALSNRREPDGALTIAGVSEEPVRLSPALVDVVMEIFRHVARSEMVQFVPYGAMLTTQQAADLLNMSRPHLIKLLTSGVIPFQTVGTHRRVAFADVMAYKARKDAEKAAFLDNLSAFAQDVDP